jgi:hypothetical protein
MDVCYSLELDIRTGRALRRQVAGRTCGIVGSIGELIGDIRSLGDESDVAIRALLEAAPRDVLAVEVVIVALLPLALARVRSREQLDEVIGELAIAVGEAARDGLPPSRRRAANVLLDRAWGQVRRPTRRVREPVVVDPVQLHRRLIDRDRDPADVAVDRVTLDAVVAALRNEGSFRAPVVRAWNVALSLGEVEDRSESDRIRLKYARQVLRRSFADLVA